MRTVREVKKQIEDLKKYEDTLGKIFHKMMFEDNEVKEYMKNTFDITSGDILPIKAYLSLEAEKLSEKLDNCEVDV